MYEVEDDKKVEKRKKKILKAGQIFLIIIIVLTFTSKSIHNLTLPKVSAKNVSSGSLIIDIVGEGVVKAIERVEYYIDFSSTVKKINVSVGDTVSKGDIILILDKESLEAELTKKEVELKKLKLQYEKALTSSIEDNLYTYEQNLKELETELSKLEEEVTVNEKLYDEGAISKKQLDDLISELDLAKMRYENAQSELEKQIEIFNRKNENQANEIELMKLDISSTEMEIEELKKEISSCTVTAPSDGIVKELNFKEGMVANNSRPVYVLDSPNKGFEMEVVLNNEECKYLEIGDQAQVFLRNENNSVLEGSIKSIKNSDNSDRKIVIAELESIELSGGETGEIYIKKPIGSYKFLIPRQALREDSEGKFVYILEEKEGPLGREYYAVRKSVKEGDSDNSNVGILSGLIGDERVIVRSSKSLDDGSQVVVEWCTGRRGYEV